MAITKIDSVLEAISEGKSNNEIRAGIDKRLSDTTIDRLREHPAMREEGDADEIEQAARDILAAGKREEAEPKKARRILPDGTMLPEGLRMTEQVIVLSGLFDYQVSRVGVTVSGRGQVAISDMERWIEEVACVAGISERLRAATNARDKEGSAD